MANSIAYTKNYTAVLDEVYKRAACSTCLNSPRRMARAGRNAKEIMVPKIEVTGLGDYTRNVGYKTGSITYEFSGDDALVRDFLGGAVTFQRCHRLRHGGGPHRLRGRHRRSRIGCRPRQTRRRRDESLVPCVRHRRPPDRLDGYQKVDQTVTWTAVIIMIVLVQIVQGIANAIAKRILKLQR